jgi:hypothetical protein
MDDILDFNEMSKLQDHLMVEAHLLDEIIDLLNQQHIKHKVRRVENSKDLEIVDVSIKLSAARYIIQVPQNMKLKVDDLVKINIDKSEKTVEVRELFLRTSMDREGLTDILLYPEQWDDGDSEIARKLLAEIGVKLSESELIILRDTKGPHKELTNHKIERWSNILMYVAFLVFAAFLIWQMMQ